MSGYQPADAQGGYQQATDQGGYPSASGQAGYQPTSAPGGYQPANGQGYQPTAVQGGYPSANGQGGYQPTAVQGGYQPVNGQGGYPSAAAPGGYPSATGQGGAPSYGAPAYGGGQGYGEPGYGAAPSGAGAYPGNGQGFAGPGYPEPGFPQTGYAGSGSPDAGAGYGYPGAGHPDAGYGSGGWFGGGSPDPGYGQPAPGGSRLGDGTAYDAAANGHGSGTYPAATTAVRRADGEFPETSATAQYGRLPSWGPDLANGEYGPSGQAGSANGRPSATPRPYGRLSIFTLLEDKAAEFDWLAEQAAEGVRMTEPDTLVYVLHVVPKAPMQRIIYEIYRDRQAFESHERQPHIQRFAADRKGCVLATNIIDLRLKYAKVAALSGSPAPAPATAPVPTPPPAAPAPSASVQETRVNQVPRALGSGWPAEGAGRYAEPGYGDSPASGERVPRSRPVGWDQPAYQEQRRGGN